MAERQRKWAARARLALRRALGMKCAGCGSRDYRRLEFDVIDPARADWIGGRNHHKIEWSWRISFYRREFTKNNLQLLCGGVGSCHGKKTISQNYDCV